MHEERRDRLNADGECGTIFVAQLPESDFLPMLVQTNSYLVPPEKREEHARMMRRFRQVLARLGCEYFEVYEQVGPNWNPTKTGGRFIQIMRFRDRDHYQAIQAAERADAPAQTLIREFSELIDLPRQEEQHQFASGFYSTLVSSVAGPAALARPAQDAPPTDVEDEDEPSAAPERKIAEASAAVKSPGNSKPRGKH